MNYKTTYVRWFVLDQLLGLPTNERGTGDALTSTKLLELWMADPPDLDLDVEEKDFSQAGRHFGRGCDDGDNHDKCLWWANENPWRGGVSREHVERAEELLVELEGMVASYEFERLIEVVGEPLELEEIDVKMMVPAGVAKQIRCGALTGLSVAGGTVPRRSFSQMPSPARDAAYLERQEHQGLSMQNAGRGGRNLDRDDPGADLDQMTGKLTSGELVEKADRRTSALRPRDAYDLALVEEYVSVMGPGPMTLTFIYALLGEPEVTGAIRDLAERFEELSIWERSNVMYRLRRSGEEALRGGEVAMIKAEGVGTGSPVKRTNAARTLVESGLLFELNRRVLHPVGLALVVEAGDAGMRIADWMMDCRDDPEGIVFDDEALGVGFRRLGAYMRERGFSTLSARYGRLRYRVQTVDEAHPFADEREWRLPGDVHPVEAVPDLDEMSETLVAALGGERDAERTRNRIAFLLERSVATRDHVATVAAMKLAEDLARVGRRLARLEAAVDEVDLEVEVGFRGVRDRVDLILREDERDDAHDE